MKIACCLEHVELALDIIVDEFETAPIIHDVDNLEENCEYCQNKAKYVVTHPQKDEHTTD